MDKKEKLQRSLRKDLEEARNEQKMRRVELMEALLYDEKGSMDKNINQAIVAFLCCEHPKIYKEMHDLVNDAIDYHAFKAMEAE